MTKQTCGEWIARFLEADPPRSKSLVMTVLGDAIAPHGGAVWLGSLIELVASLTVTDRLARTSVFRLVQEGWLNASREGRRSRYTLEPAALPRLQRANHRIYSAPGLGWDGRWTVLLAPNGTLPADLRATLRRELQWEGYAMLSAGVMAHPSYEPEALDDILHRNGGDGRLFAFAASTLPDVASRPLAGLVDEGWNLSAVVDSFQHFVDTFTPLLQLLKDGPPADPATAFAIRTLLVHAYRRVLLHDPRLPLELLPPVWPGTYAYELARAIYQLTYQAAEEHLMAALRREDPESPEADDAFYRRFDGLPRAAAAA